MSDFDPDPYDPYEEDDEPCPLIFAWGPCCACLQDGIVRNLIMLHEKAPVPGTGWACVVCGLPPDGALTVLCDDCLERGVPPKYAVSGPLTLCGRVPIETLSGRHEHNLALHEEDILHA